MKNRWCHTTNIFGRFRVVAAVLALSLMLSMLAGCGAVTAAKSLFGKVVSGAAREKRSLTAVFDHVYDAGTYTSLDYDFAESYFEREYDNYSGGCTAVAKVNSAGDTLVGRNLDLNISNKPAYILRTAVEGCYKTIGLMYTFRDITPDDAEVRQNGISGDFEKVLPFLTEDVLNEKGLYIEINMRKAEFWPTGDPKFYCPGTNPAAKQSVCLFELPRYIGEHCATVDEALAYVDTLNVYGRSNSWGYSFMIADATGHYGVLEFGMNRPIWTEGQQAQTNFFINEDLAAIQELKVGVGRYDQVMDGIDAVDSEAELFSLMDSVSFFQFYSPDTCGFDLRSEAVGVEPYATYDVVMDEKNQDYIMEEVYKLGDRATSMSRQEQRDANEFWESAFTEVVNCNARTITVRFFEDDDMILKLGFDE